MLDPTRDRELPGVDVSEPHWGISYYLWYFDIGRRGRHDMDHTWAQTRHVPPEHTSERNRSVSSSLWPQRGVGFPPCVLQPDKCVVVQSESGIMADMWGLGHVFKSVVL